MMVATVPISLNLLGDDSEVIGYRKKFAALTGSVTTAILLGRILHWSKVKGFKPFYKFRQPCNHDLYKSGDSWIEDLEFTPAEFDNALKVIGTKIRKGISRKELEAVTFPVRAEGESDDGYFCRYRDALRHIIIYWTDNAHVTWYQVNGDLLDKFINSIYLTESSGLKHLRRSVYADILERRKVDSDQIPDQTQEDKLQKEVVVARPRLMQLFNCALPPSKQLHTAVAAPRAFVIQLSAQEKVHCAEVITLFTEAFGARFAPDERAAMIAISEFGLGAIRTAITEGAATHTGSIVQWGYVLAILKRHADERYRESTHVPHGQFLGMRPNYQAPSQADNMIYIHPLWKAYRSKWFELTGDELPVPPMKVKQYADTARLLDTLKVSAEEVMRLVDKKWAAGKHNYSFLYVPEHIGEIYAEDAHKRKERDAALVQAVCKVWKNAPGDFTHGIVDILASMDNPPTADEVTKFGTWYAGQPQFKAQVQPPTSADLLVKRLSEYRGAHRASGDTGARQTFTPLPSAQPLTTDQLLERERIKREIFGRRQGEGALS